MKPITVVFACLLSAAIAGGCVYWALRPTTPDRFSAAKELGLIPQDWNEQKDAAYWEDKARKTQEESAELERQIASMPPEQQAKMREAQKQLANILDGIKTMESH